MRTVRSRLCASTRARNAARSFAYASSVSRLSRVMLGIGSSGESVREAEERQRMELLRLVRAPRLRDPLLDPPAGDRAVGTDVVRFGFLHPPEHRLADLHRAGEE